MTLRSETSIYADATPLRYAAMFITPAVVVLIFVFLYMLHYGVDTNQNVVTYGTATVAGLLIAASISF